MADKIITGNIEGVGIAIGTGTSVKIYGDIHYYPIKLCASLREVFDPLIEDRTKLFGGRDADLTRIAQFIQNPYGGYFVITAPAGFGKTALMASLISGTPDAFAYHFFTPLYGDGNLSEDFFLRNVVEQMAQWHGRKELLPTRLEELRALYQQFITQPLECTQILIIDGLDEVTRWKLAPYLSRHLPKQLHIIVTIRDTDQEWQNIYQFPADQMTWLPLDGLNRDGVIQVLNAAGRDALVFVDDPNLLDKVINVTTYKSDVRLGADPLYVRWLAEDAAEGKLTPADIVHQPPGLNNYLDNWWQQIKKVAGKKTMQDLFGTLTVALGPIGRIELETLNPSLVDEWAIDFFDDVLRQVRRWVAGNDVSGYALAHPRLRMYMCTRIKTKYYLAKLLTYCADWQKHHSAYALAYYAQHLFEAGQTNVLYKLISKSWMDLKFKYSLSHHSFAEDVNLAIQVAAADESPRGMMQLVYNCLLYATLGERSTNIPSKALGTLALIGGVSSAIGYATLIQKKEKRFEAYLTILTNLPIATSVDIHKKVLQLTLAAEYNTWTDINSFSQMVQVLAQAGETALAQQILDRALVYAKSVHPNDANYYLAKVAMGLTQIGETAQAEAVAQYIDNGWKPVVLSKVALKLAQTDETVRAQQMLDRALILAKTIFSVRAKVRTLSEVAQRLVQIGETVEAQQVLDDALTVAEAIENSDDWLEKGALNVAVGIENSDDWLKARALSEVAQGLVQTGQTAQAQQILDRILSLVESYLTSSSASRRTTDNKTPALSNIAQVLVQTGTFDRALTVAEAIVDNADRVWMMSEIALKLAQTGQMAQAQQVLDRVLTLTQNMYLDQEINEGYKASALIKIAQRLAQVALIDRAITVAHEIPHPAYKVIALSKVALELVQAAQTAQAQQMLDDALIMAEAIENSDDSWHKARALGEVAQGLVQTGQTAQAQQMFERALAIAKTSSRGIYLKEQLVRSMAQLLARAGMFDQALSTMRRIGISSYYPEIQREVVQGLVQAEAFDRALAIAKGMDATWPVEKARALVKVAEGLIQAGQMPQAQQVLNYALVFVRGGISGGRTARSQALVEVARGLIQAGQIPQAQQVLSDALATRDVGCEDKAKWLSQVAQKLAQVGETAWAQQMFDRALEETQSSYHNYERASTLCIIAQELIRAQMSGAARGTVVQALSVARFHSRKSVFATLETAVSLFTTPDQAQTLWQIYKAIEEVDSWWEGVF